MAHRRLAVIDLSVTGAQPMQFARSGLTISYNGEIYNYRELRAELLALWQTEFLRVQRPSVMEEVQRGLSTPDPGNGLGPIQSGMKSQAMLPESSNSSMMFGLTTVFAREISSGAVAMSVGVPRAVPVRPAAKPVSMRRYAVRMVGTCLTSL